MVDFFLNQPRCIVCGRLMQYSTGNAQIPLEIALLLVQMGIRPEYVKRFRCIFEHHPLSWRIPSNGKNANLWVY
jgi:hypothetical protein